MKESTTNTPLGRTEGISVEPTGFEVSYRVDPTVCEAYGVCLEVAEDIFDADDWGYAQTTKTGLLSPSERARAEKAYQECPVKAIRRLNIERK